MKAIPDPDTLIQYALGTLEPDLAWQVQEAVIASPALALELAAWQKSLSLFALDVPQHNVPNNLEAKILERIRQPNVRPAPTIKTRQLPQSRSATFWTRAVAFPVAALAIAAFFGWRSLQLESQVSALSSQVNQISTQSQARISILSQSSLVKLASNQNTPIGQAFLTPEGKLVIALKLPTPQTGKTYQAWFIAKGESAPRPLETFSQSLDTSIPANAVAVAISLEPTGGSSTPTEVLGVGAVKL